MTDNATNRPSLKELAGDARSGFVCAKCGCHNFRVYYTRPKDARILRRRECRNCGHLITTVERQA